MVHGSWFMVHGGKVVHYNCGLIHGGGPDINALKKWYSNDSGGLGFLTRLARTYVKSRDITLHFNGKLLMFCPSLNGVLGYCIVY